MNDSRVLALTEVTKVYDSLKAVDTLSFSVQAGEVVGLLGPNGAGKSTTINMILGLLEATSGTIEVFGKFMPQDRTDISMRMNFAAVYAHMPANLTVEQNLRVFGMLYKVTNLKQRISEVVEEFELEQFLTTKAGVLSSGELSRLNMAKAVINKPELLLLDEPTASLDPHIALEVRQKIQSYVRRSHTAVLWTSHNMREIEAVCDRVLFLAHGKMLLDGNPRTLPAEHNKTDLEELFISIARQPLHHNKDKT